jgi:hypothetical protein
VEIVVFSSLSSDKEGTVVVEVGRGIGIEWLAEVGNQDIEVALHNLVQQWV